jgi:hypothetical protein
MLGTVVTLQLIYEQSTISFLPVFRWGILSLRNLSKVTHPINSRVGIRITFNLTTMFTIYLKHIFYYNEALMLKDFDSIQQVCI